jgi:hypothetical protein
MGGEVDVKACALFARRFSFDDLNTDAAQAARLSAFRLRTQAGWQGG